MTVDLSTLTAEQLAALFQHLMELDQVRLALNNHLTAAMLKDPDLTDRQRKSITDWAFDQQEISNRSDAEIPRIVAGAPSTLN